MSITDKGIIDMIGRSDINNHISLGITDHLTWKTDNNDHINLLVDKLNDVINYILGGQIKERYEDWEKSNIEIRLMFKYQPPNEVLQMINDIELKIKEIIKNSFITIKVG